MRIKRTVRNIFWPFAFAALFFPSLSYSAQLCASSKINLINKTGTSIRVLRLARTKPTLLTNIAVGQIIPNGTTLTALANPLATSGTGLARGRIFLIAGTSLIRITYFFSPDKVNNLCVARAGSSFNTIQNSINVDIKTANGTPASAGFTFTTS